MGAIEGKSSGIGARRPGRGLFPALSRPAPISNPKGDITGAVAAALISVPQAMAYGILAVSAAGPESIGVGVLAGLYGTALVGLLAVILGSNPVVVAGPGAATVLVLSGLIGHLLTLPGTTVPQAFALAGVAVLIAGALQAAFGMLRLGRLTDYIPYPVVAGFLNASALLILLSQITPLTGLSLSLDSLSPTALAEALSGITPGPLALGLLTASVILVAARLSRRVAPPVVGVAVGLAVYHLGAALGYGAWLGGTVPVPTNAAGFGLAEPGAILAAARLLDTEMLALILPAALSIAALNALDAAMATASMDQITLRRSSASRDMGAQGVANVAAGVLGLLPGAGSLSRSAALYRAGGRTALAPLAAAAAILVLTAGLTPLIGLLPKAVTAGLLVAVGIQLFDRWTLGLLRRIRWRTLSRQPLDDLLAIALVVATALAVNLIAAVFVGVVVSLVFFVIRSARTPVRRSYHAGALASLMQGDHRRLAFIEAHGDAIAVVELEGSLFFGSVAALQAEIDAQTAAGAVHVVLDMKRVKDMDATAAHAIGRLHLMQRARGGLLALAYVQPERRAGRRRPGFSGPDRRRQPSDRRLWRALETAGQLDLLEGNGALHQDRDTALSACEHALAESLSGTRAGRADAPFKPQILHAMGRGEIRRLWSFAERLQMNAGDIVFREGDPPDSLYFIAAGTVDVIIAVARSDRRMRLQTLRAGSIFGEMAVIDPKPRSATLAAAERTVLYRLSAEAFERMKAEEPALAFRLLENLTLIFSRRLRASNTLVAELEA